MNETVATALWFSAFIVVFVPVSMLFVMLVDGLGYWLGTKIGYGPFVRLGTVLFATAVLALIITKLRSDIALPVN